MDVVIHCASCDHPIPVPQDAAGQQMQCPNCGQAFTAPAHEGELEDTITDWIMHDVEEMLQFKDKAIEHAPLREQTRLKSGGSTAAGARPRPVRVDEEDDLNDQTRLGGSTLGGSAVFDEDDGGADESSEASGGGSGDSAPKPTDSISGETIEHRYPTNLLVRDPIPHLVVNRVNSAGVRFAFDARWLKDEGFRASMPMRCAFTGEDNCEKLIARPLIFKDRFLRSEVSVEKAASSHITRKLKDKHPRQVVRGMGRMETLHEPFCHAMPFYVSTKYAHHTLHVETHDRGGGSITAVVLIPDPPTALAWLGRVNGVCGAEYELLEHDVSLLHGSAWRQLDTACRGRLDVWCKLDPNENFRAYFNDADFGKRDAGLAGLVVTDRRLIFHKHHRRGHVKLNRPNTSLLAHLDGNMAQLTLEHDGSRHRMVTVRSSDLKDIKRLMAGTKVQLVML